MALRAFENIDSNLDSNLRRKRPFPTLKRVSLHREPRDGSRGLDANLEQLKAGLAWMYREYERELSVEDRRAYDQAEASARAAKRGLWRDPRPQPPWEVRHPETAKGPSAVAGAAAGSVMKPDYLFCGVPDHISIPKTVSRAFPGVFALSNRSLLRPVLHHDVVGGRKSGDPMRERTDEFAQLTPRATLD